MAEPYFSENIFARSDAKLAILDDASLSFDVFEEGYGEMIYEELEGSNVEYEKIGQDLVSNIGDQLLSKIKEADRRTMASI